MTDMATVGERIGPFFGAMIEKLSLSKNQAKGDWREESVEWLIGRLEQEVAELKVAAAKRDWKSVLRETPDVANFAGMIYDVCATNTDQTSWDART